jgi:SNF2 family DNA or RNA helicase
MRRLIEYCPELKIRRGTNSTGDEFRSDEPCGRELHILCEAPQYDSEGESTGQFYQVLACGHHRFIDQDEWISRPAAQRNILWNKLLPCQQEMVKKFEEVDFNGYMDAEMGTGKTVIAATILREHLEELTPCLIICEAGDIYRWQKELRKWLGLSQMKVTNPEEMADLLSLTPQILTKSTTNAGLSRITITSWTNISDEKFLKFLGNRKYKLIIADEAHMFKNEDAGRAQGFIKMCSFIPHRIFLSGTPIENSISELFVPLNILDPKFFNSRSALESYCLVSSRGKALTLDPHRRDFFFARTNRYFFRLTKEQANIRLPRLFSYTKGNRQPIWIDPSEFKSNLEFIKDYNAVLDALEEELESKRPEYGNIMGFMSQLRHHTGKMKVMSAAQLISLRMMEMPSDQKLCIGVHHKAVMLWLRELLEKLGHKCLTISDETPEIKDAIEDEFRKPGHRILIASILGAGKGRNLQFCQNAIVLERQWNRSKESQFEQRFHRIKVDANDSIITEFTDRDDVVIDYIMATKSFDEYFDHLVNLKGQIVDSADSSVEDAPDPSFVYELARMVVSKRIQYVGM